MSPRLRLALCAAMILFSASYAVLVSNDRDLAEVVALGYIGVMLTLIFIVNVWKHP